MNDGDSKTTDTPPVIAYAARAARIESAMLRLTQHVPSTKGYGPKDRAEFLHAELEGRRALAKEALRFHDGERAYE